MGNCWTDALRHVNTNDQILKNTIPINQQFPNQLHSPLKLNRQLITLAFMHDHNICTILSEFTELQKQQIAQSLAANQVKSYVSAKGLYIFIEKVLDQTINPENNLIPAGKQKPQLRLVIGHCAEGSQMINGEGFIIYNKAFYIGQLKSNKAHGKGGMEFISEDNTHVIAKVYGSWKQNQIAEVKCTNHKKQEIMSLTMTSTRQATVHLPSGIVYKGTIKQQGVTEFKQIITGYGQIRYINGDHYKGLVVDGEMHTVNQGVHELGTLEYRDGRIYKGGFRWGRRHGDGILMQVIEGTQFMQINAVWQDNIPIQIHYIKRVYGDGESDWMWLPRLDVLPEKKNIDNDKRQQAMSHIDRQ